jgi:hypothetical protein
MNRSRRRSRLSTIDDRIAVLEELVEPGRDVSDWVREAEEHLRQGDHAPARSCLSAARLVQARKACTSDYAHRGGPLSR